VLFRAASFAAASAAAGEAFRLAGGEVGTLKLLDDLAPLVALAVVYLTVRAFLLHTLSGRESFDPRLGASAGEVAFGAVVALLAIGHPWDVVVVVPLGLAVQQAHARLQRLQRETLRALETFANIVDERDPSTYRHSIRVAGYVDGLARALQLPFSEIDRLRWAGRLHDLGKVAVDATVLRKPGRLDREEWAAVRRHPRLSARLLQRFEFVATQARAVELHHERFDGGGYYGLAGEDLPLAAHFLIVADSFDAMTTDRPYRPARSREEALAEIERHLGTQFHPTVGKAFVAVQRGLEPAEALTPAELAEIRGASVSYHVGSLPGAGDLAQRPELLALGGLVLALAGLGFGQAWLTALGTVVGAVGIVLRTRARIRSERLTESLRAALEAPDRETVFLGLVDRLAHAWPISWAALVNWDEDGLGGRFEYERGDGPPEAAVTSWLVREAESGSEAIAADGAELGRHGMAIALPLRRETSALVGFLVFDGPRLPPRHVQLALRETLDELGLALADRPPGTSGLSGGRSEEPQPFEAVPDALELPLARLDQR
jgi:HD-GYP domain-containing protein (c-di-GMP phosphodiesterase class II)